MLRNLQQNGISVANDSVGFRSAKAGTVLPTHAAVSNVTGSAPFLVAERTTLDRSGKASSLSADAVAGEGDCTKTREELRRELEIGLRRI